MRHFFRRLFADLRWQYNHWVCRNDGHQPAPIAGTLLLTSTPGSVCTRCGDWMQDLDTKRAARKARRAARKAERRNRR